MELYRLEFLSESFLKAYTLAIYRKWRDEVYDTARCIEAEDVSRKAVEFGKMLSGPRMNMLQPLVELILEPGSRFWGLKANVEERFVKERALELVDEAMIEKMSTLVIYND